MTYYSSRWMHGDTITVDGQITSIQLSQLIPYTIYNITVSAATIVGFGPSSNGLLVRTLPAGKYNVMLNYLYVLIMPSSSYLIYYFSSRCKSAPFKFDSSKQ